MVERITVAEIHARFKAQGVSSREHIAFVCPICATVQSGADFMRVTGKPMAEVEKWLGFSCIGRHTGAGGHKKGSPPGNGCDWSLGGLFQLHRLVVITDDGKEHPSFEVASPEVAQTHERRTLADA